MGYGSIGLVAVATLLTLVSITINASVCFGRLGLKLSFHNLKFGMFKEMWWFTFFIFINQIVNQINWNVDKYLLGRMCGTTVVAVYSIGGQLRNYFSIFSSSISNTFIPQINDIVAEGKDDCNRKLTDIFINIGKIQSYVILLILTGFILFGKQFIILWAGTDYIESYYIAVMLFGVLTVPYIQNIGVEIQRAKNKHRVRSLVYLIIAVVNILISIPLIKSYGATGATVGTVIAVFFCNVVFMNIYYEKAIGLNIIRFWTAIIRVIPSVLLASIIGWGITKIWNINSWLKLTTSIAVYSVVYVVFVINFGMTKETKMMLLNKLRIWKIN